MHRVELEAVEKAREDTQHILASERREACFQDPEPVRRGLRLRTSVASGGQVRDLDSGGPRKASSRLLHTFIPISCVCACGHAIRARKVGTFRDTFGRSSGRHQ